LVILACLIGFVWTLVHRERNASSRPNAESTVAQVQPATPAPQETEVQRSDIANARPQPLREPRPNDAPLRDGGTLLQREIAKDPNQAAPTLVTNALAGAPVAPSQTAIAPFTGTVQATLGSGQTLVTGGWPTVDGKRTLAFSTPTVTDDGNVLVETAYVELPEEMLAGQGWEDYRAVTSATSAIGMLTAEKEAQFLAALQGTEGVSILSSPKVLTPSGTIASIYIGDAAGVGQEVTIAPVVSADGQSVNLSVSHLIQTFPHAAPSDP
jgi:hypothetical protein